MSLIKNLRRREVEIFGAKRVVRNDDKKGKITEKKQKSTSKKKKKTEVK